MRKKERLVFTFFIFLILSIIILVLSFFGKLAWPQSFLEKNVSFLPKTFFGFFQRIPFISESQQIKRLKLENLTYASKLVDQEKLKKENAALLSQFQQQDLQTHSLLPAQIVGAPGFIPGITTPSNFILDKGAKDNVSVGDSVVVKNNLVGKVSKVSSYLSKVDIITNSSVVLSAKTISGAIGVVKGGGGDKMTLDNVLPSQNLKINELVLTKGDVDIDGTGIPADFVIGKIQSIEKVPTAIFQRAEVKSLINFTKQSIVFIVILPD
jgi:cell shape-determining protein MreC